MSGRLFLLLGVLCSSTSVTTAFVAAPAKFAASSRLYTATNDAEVESVDNVVEPKNELLPEFEEALLKAKGAVNALAKDLKPELIPGLEYFCNEYITANQKSFLKTDSEDSSAAAAFQRILDGFKMAMTNGMGPNKYKFGATHTALRGNPETEDGNTLDYYKWGCDFFRPIMDLDDSLVEGKENLDQAMAQIAAGENVVFLANHQSEADPQVVSMMLEKAGYGKEAEELVYVAGHKVTTDALAIPFSMGRNLICIHSKKHINADPETKSKKSRENLAAMSGMLGKMKKGGCVLWVAPSGGRDRRDVESGKTPIAPFDSKTIDMFRLMGNKSKTPTHYYSFAMVSYELCPPPDFVEAGVGEQRNFRFAPVGVTIGKELVSEGGLEKRHHFCDAAFAQTNEDYVALREKIFPGTAPALE